MLAAILRVDLAGAEAREWLAAAGIDCVLLKGRAFAERLYEAAWQRPYSDTDLLIRVEDLERAERLLREHAYERVDRDGDRLGAPGYAHTFARSDGSLIDLHWNLSGVRASPVETWEAVAESTGLLKIGGRSTRVPGDPVTALIAALHNAHHGAQWVGTLPDLERAIQTLELSDWIAAARLADRLGAGEPFAAGLRLSPAGERLADRIGTDGAISLEYRLRSDPTSYGAWALHRLASAKRPRERIRVIGEILFPPPRSMRVFFPLARRGPRGLLAAYLLRPGRLARAAAPAIREYVKARRRAGDG